MMSPFKVFASITLLLLVGYSWWLFWQVDIKLFIGLTILVICNHVAKDIVKMK